MYNYLIDSINHKYCINTSLDTLDEIEMCQNCNHIPLPSYRSYLDPKIILCKSCYISLNKNLEHLVIPSRTEIKVLGKLVISCKNSYYGCHEEFSLQTLDILLIHQQNCDKKLIICPVQECKRCGKVKSNHKLHDCFAQFRGDYFDPCLRESNHILKNEIEMMKDELNKQRLSFDEEFKSQANEIIHLQQIVQNYENSFNKKIKQNFKTINKKFDDKFESQANEINHLKQIVQDYEISFDKKFEQIVHNFNSKIEDKLYSKANEINHPKQIFKEHFPEGDYIKDVIKKKGKDIDFIPIPKKKHPLDSLLPSSFILDNFKKYFINSQDKKGAMKKFWQEYDPNGYSLWLIQFQNLPSEGKNLLKLCNYSSFFLQKLQNFRNYTFSSHGVYGDKENFLIKGLWMWRGIDISPQMKDHHEFEYHTFKKLDSNNENDRKIVEDYWINIDTGYFCEGLKIQKVVYFN